MKFSCYENQGNICYRSLSDNWFTTLTISTGEQAQSNYRLQGSSNFSPFIAKDGSSGRMYLPTIYPAIPYSH